MTRTYLNLFVLFFCLTLGSCGTGVGNPFTGDDDDSDGDLGFDFPPIITDSDFTELQKNYTTYDLTTDPQGSDCGRFNQDSSTESIAVGENCIRTSLTNCHLAKYYIDITYGDESRLASFISVVKTNATCKLYVTTLSTHSENFYGRYQDNCESVDVSTDLKFACR